MTKDKLPTLIGDKIRQVFGQSTEIRSLDSIAGDASSRRYFRAILSGLKTPPSIVIMNFPAGTSLPLSSEELAIFKEPPKELPFLNLHRFLKNVGVRVPALYGAWEDEGFLLLEDLGDTALWDKVQGSGEDEVMACYQKAIDELLLLQVRGSDQRDDSCLAFQQQFDFRLYMWEFDHFLEYALEKQPSFSVPTSLIAELRKAFAEIARRLDSQPSGLSHRDYHSWNLMFHNDSIAVIDFQDALLAPPQYDLASLLNDRITDRVIRPPLEQLLVSYYMDRRAEMTKRKIPRDEFFEIYLLSAIQRDLKVVGRFHYLDLVKGKPAYKKFIPPTLHRLKRNLARAPKLQKLIPLLADYFEELR